MSKDIIKNKYGFFELLNKPTRQELEKHYSEKYYQESSSGSYDLKYSDQEIQYFNNKIHQKILAIQDILVKRPGRFLDVGSGEGFALKYFQDLGWLCTGLDYSLFGVKTHNPEQAKCVIAGDIFNNLAQLIKNKEKFNLIWLDNVLEHVIDPYQLMIDLHKILDANGVLVVEVPNDFSIVQQHLLANNYIDREFWVSPLDHISYFSRDGLTNLAVSSGWCVNKFLSDYPIDLDLFSHKTNYIKNPDLGKSSHLRRLDIENLLHSISPEKTNVLYEALAKLGLGRCITGFFTKKISN
jgi:SAM-dependent methyltransferase